MITNEIITQKANECISIFNPSFEIPFPVDRISDIDNNLLVTIADYSDDDVSGFITYDGKDKKYKIFVNSAKHHHRVNFTLAHELGHYFLHRDILSEKDFLDGNDTLDGTDILYRKDSKDQNVNPQYEREANRFAARVLMPEKQVKKAWGMFHNVEICANIFDVSVIAMSIRIEELGLINDR